MGVKISPRLSQKIQAIESTVGSQVERRLVHMAEDIVRLSPVDTGAFVNSWSFKDNPSGGRRKSSAGKPTRRNAASERGKSLNNLVNDISLALGAGSTRGSTKVFALQVSAAQFYFLNRAPHAAYVDLKHGVMAQIRNIHG